VHFIKRPNFRRGRWPAPGRGCPAAAPPRICSGASLARTSRPARYVRRAARRA